MMNNFKKGLEGAWEEFLEVYDNLGFCDRQEIDAEYKRALTSLRSFRSGELGPEDARKTAAMLRRLKRDYQDRSEERQQLLNDLEVAYREILGAREEGRFSNDYHAKELVVAVSGCLEGCKDKTPTGLSNEDIRLGLELAEEELKKIGPYREDDGYCF